MSRKALHMGHKGIDLALIADATERTVGLAREMPLLMIKACNGSEGSSGACINHCTRSNGRRWKIGGVDYAELCHLGEHLFPIFKQESV